MRICSSAHQKAGCRLIIVSIKSARAHFFVGSENRAGRTYSPGCHHKNRGVCNQLPTPPYHGVASTANQIRRTRSLIYQITQSCAPRLRFNASSYDFKHTSDTFRRAKIHEPLIQSHIIPFVRQPASARHPWEGP